MTPTKVAETVQQIPVQSGRGFLKQVFGGKRWIPCIKELLKNSRDWEATQILIVTEEDRNQLRFLDNGRGMDADNRRSFCSVNVTTANETQSGKFDTGTKQMLYSWASRVTVRTVPGDDPTHVHVFSVSTDEYEQLFLTRGMVEDRILPKNRSTWPFDFPTGTEITYLLDQPRERGILRGRQLAEELAAVLQRRFTAIVSVDGEPLPEKEVIGDLYRVIEQVPGRNGLGEVLIELYQPKRRRGEEALLLTAVEVGEVPFENFVRVLTPAQREVVPRVFLLRETCGTISVSYFKNYANEDRQTFRPAIAADPRTDAFLTLLAQHAPAIEQTLELTTEPATADAEKLIDEAIEQINRAYIRPGERPPESSGEGEKKGGSDEDGGSGTGRGRRRTQPMLHLSIPRREFAVGETITVTARLRRDLVDRYSLTDLKWYTSRSNATSRKNLPNGVMLRAETIGRGEIRADIPRTRIDAVVRYDVVEQRVFHFATPHLEVSSGGTLLVTTCNHDLILGELQWRVDGVGKLDPEGHQAQYHAGAIGRAVVTAWDSADHSRRDSCDIVVTSRNQPRKFRIRDTWFEYSPMNLPGHRFVGIQSSGDQHRLIINRRSPGYDQAVASGRFGQFFVQSVATEYARWERLEHNPLDPHPIEPYELRQLFEEVLTLGDEVYAEIIAKH